MKQVYFGRSLVLSQNERLLPTTVTQGLSNLAQIMIQIEKYHFLDLFIKVNGHNLTLSFHALEIFVWVYSFYAFIDTDCLSSGT